jgi:hypothetical protein
LLKYGFLIPLTGGLKTEDRQQDACDRHSLSLRASLLLRSTEQKLMFDVYSRLQSVSLLNIFTVMPATAIASVCTVFVRGNKMTRGGNVGDGATDLRVGAGSKRGIARRKAQAPRRRNMIKRELRLTFVWGPWMEADFGIKSRSRYINCTWLDVVHTKLPNPSSASKLAP